MSLRPRGCCALVLPLLAFASLPLAPAGLAQAGEPRAPLAQLRGAAPAPAQPAGRRPSPEELGLVAPPATVPSVAPPLFPSAPAPGPVPRPLFEFHPGLRVSEEYSDNFRFSAGDEEENYRTSVSPELTLFITGALIQGEVGYLLSGVHDSSDDDYSLHHALRGRVGWQATPRWTLTVWDEFTLSDDPGQADQLTLRRERREFTRNTAAVESDYLIGTVGTRQFYRFTTFDEDGGPETRTHSAGASAAVSLYQTNSVTLGYDFLRSDTSGGGSEVTGHEGSASVSRQVNPQLTFGLSGSYGLRTVEDRVPGEGGTLVTAENDYSIWSASLFGRYQVGEIWTLSVSGGYSRLAGQGRFGDAEAPTGSIALTVRLGPGTLTLGGNAGFSETFATGENFGVVETRGVRGALSYPFTPFITGTGSLFYRENELTDVVVTGEERTEIGREEEAWGGAVVLAIQLLRWLTLELEYAYTDAKSSLPDRDYTENRGRATLSATF